MVKVYSALFSGSGYFLTCYNDDCSVQIHVYNISNVCYDAIKKK